MNNRSITPLPPADFTPEMGNYRTLQPFRYWCQKVLPLVYDDSLSYYELLCKVVDYLNKTMEDVETLHGDVTNIHTAYEELQNYVHMYFSSLDVQEEINNKLDEMATNGTLLELINPLVTSLVISQVTKWLTDNVNPNGSMVTLDSSLTIKGSGADSKAVGDYMSIKAGGILGSLSGGEFDEYNTIFDVPGGYYLCWANALNKLFPNNPFEATSSSYYGYVLIPKFEKRGFNSGFCDVKYRAVALIFYRGNETYIVYMDNGSNYIYKKLDKDIDKTLTKNDMPADAKTVGDIISDIENKLNNTSKKILISPNGEKYLLGVNDNGEIFTIPLIPKKSVFYGNSLLLGFKTFGMAASDNKHDYAYLLSQRFNGGTIEKVSSSTFEGSTTIELAENWIEDNITNSNFSDIDLVLIQLGDNVNNATKKDVFKISCKKFIKSCKIKYPKARIVWCYGWYKDAEVKETIINACSETGIEYINFVNNGKTNKIGNIYTTTISETISYDVDSFDVLSSTKVTLHFTVDGKKYNTTINCDYYSSSGGTSITITGKNHVITSAGVASHPSNDGFSYIANTIIAGLML